MSTTGFFLIGRKPDRGLNRGEVAWGVASAVVTALVLWVWWRAGDRWLFELDRFWTFDYFGWRWIVDRSRYVFMVGAAGAWLLAWAARLRLHFSLYLLAILGALFGPIAMGLLLVDSLD